MKDSFKRGIGFGVVSGIITTLGLIVGLGFGVRTRVAVVGGIITIAIADAFSDALGIHISEESTKRSNKKTIWEATLSTFFAKFIIAITFLVPFVLFSLSNAIIVSVAWGFVLLAAFNYFLAKEKRETPFFIIFEHLAIAFVVVAASYFVGKFVFVYLG